MDLVVHMFILCCVSAYMLIPTFAQFSTLNEEDNFEVTEEIREERFPKCAFNEIYKEEYYKGPQKLKTLIRCECDGHYARDYIRSEETMGHFYKKDHQCLGAVRNITDPCDGENATCRIDIRQDYGLLRNGTYTDNRYTYCRCEPEEMKCTSIHESKYVTQYACSYPVCMEDDLCRILEYSARQELKQNITLCHCTGECSYRPENSIAFSRKYKNITEYYTCQFPSPLQATTRTLLEESTGNEDLCASFYRNRFSQ